MMDKKPATSAVVITGADLPTDMATARSLKRLHVELVGLYKNKKSVFVRSRFWDRLIYLGEKAEPGQYMETLRQLGRSASRPIVLFPTQDEIVQLVSDHREELSRWFKFVLPAKETVDTFLDKTKFHPWAVARGFSVPPSCLVSSRKELESALNSLGYPVILKPLYKTVEWERHGRQKAYRLNSRLDFETIGFDLFQDAPRFIVQRWIEGGDANVHFCLTCCSSHGEELGYYTGKKLLQWPIGTGSTAICVGTENEKVRVLTREIFQAGQFRGLGSVEFKYSSKEHKYYVTEPTVGRPNLQSYVATAGGVNLIEMAYWNALDEIPRKIHTRRKAIWLDEQFARRSVSEMTECRILLFKEILRAIFGGAVLSFAYFRIVDPLPFATWCRESVFKLFRKYRYEATIRELATKDIEPNVPPGALFILVDKGLGLKIGGHRRSVPFPERDGKWAGYPADDAAAIAELERLRSAGVQFMIFPAPMFYWLDVYPELKNRLLTQCRCVVNNDRALIYDLRS